MSVPLIADTIDFRQGYSGIALRFIADDVERETDVLRH